MAQDQKNTTFYVLLGPDQAEYAVTAAYLSVDERLFPGWVQLKDEAGVVAAIVHADPGVMIRRADSDPHRVRAEASRASQPVQPHVQVHVQGDPPSPAQMAVLAGRLGPAVRRT